MTGTCSLCGRRGAVQRHHLTGRIAPDGEYLDPDLVIPLCVPCHIGCTGAHTLLRAVGREFPAEPADVLDHRLFRVALHLDVSANAERPFSLSPRPAHAFAGLLREAAAGMAE